MNQDDLARFWRDLRHQLDVVLRVTAVAVLVAAILPVQVSGRRLSFVHELWSEWSFWELIGAAAPVAAAVALALLTLSSRPRVLGLAVATVVTGGCALLLTGLNPAVYLAVVAMGGSTLRQPGLVLLIFVAVGATGAWARHPGGVALVRGGWVVAAAAAAAYLLAFERGVPTALHVVRGMVDAMASDQAVVVRISVAVGTVVALVPVGLVLAAAPLLARSPSARWGLVVSRTAACLLPALALLLGYQLLMVGGGAPSLLVSVRASILLGAAIIPLVVGLDALGGQIVAAPVPLLSSGEPLQLARDRVLCRVATELNQQELDPSSSPTWKRLSFIARWALRRRLDQLRLDANADSLTAIWARLRVATEAPRDAWTRAAAAWLQRPWPGVTVVFVVAFAVAAAAGALAPPEKGVAEWELGEPTAEADELFGKTLPRYVVTRIERNQRSARHEGSAEAAYRFRELRRSLEDDSAALSPELAAAVSDFADEMDELDIADRTWTLRVEAINAEIRRLGLPYYADPDIYDTGDQRYPYIKTYRVETITRFAADERLFAAIRVRRLDHLNVRSSLLGFSRDEQPFALVLLDEVDAYAARLLPWLYAETPSCQGPEVPPGTWQQELDQLCGQRLRDTLDAYCADVHGYDEATGALGRRATAWNALALRRAAVGAPTYYLPDKIVLSDYDLRQIERHATPGDEPHIEAITAANAELRELAPETVFAAATRLLVETTERHELQHQVDGPELTTPRPLYDLLFDYSDAAVARAARELSGYLAELSLSDVHAELALAHLLLFVTQPGFRNTAEHYAAVIVLSSLSGLDTLDEGRAINVDAVTEAYETIGAMDEPTRHTKLREVYEELFSRDLFVGAVSAPDR